MKIDIQDFIQYLTIRKKLAPTSINTYAIRYRVIDRWLSQNNTALSKQTIEDFLYEKKTKDKLSNSAINTYIHTFSHIDNYCKDRSLPYGFMDDIESLPKQQSEIVILSEEEMEKLLDTHLEYKNRNGVFCNDLDLKYLALTRFVAITGCRFEEASLLKIKRLDIENGRATLVNTKNKSNRFIFFEGPIKDDLAYLIKDRKPEDLVFTNSKGQHIHDGDFNKDLRLRAKKAGITKYVHTHLLRHCFGTELVKAGVDISMVASLLGHKDIQTTFDTYLHLADDTLQKASMRNPIVSKYIAPREILQMVKESIGKFKLENNPRFKVSMSEKDNKFRLEISID